MFTPSGNNQHNGFSGSSDVEDKDDVKNKFDAFNQHDEERGQKEVV